MKIETLQDSRIGIECYKRKCVISLFSRCGCGKYKDSRYRGVICEKCGMEVRYETKIDIPREVLNYYLKCFITPAREKI